MKTETHFKRVIKGKLYNTETADALILRMATYTNYDSGNPITLYRTKKGAFFLVEEKTRRNGEGEIVKYANFKVLSQEEAKAWVEEWANEAYERVFGEPEEA